MNDPKEDMPVAEAGPVELFEPEPELATEQSAATEAATAGPGEAADELDEDEQETGPEDSVEAEAADAPAAAVDASAADEPSDSAETGAPAPEEPVGEALITAEASAREPETAEEEAPANAADEEEAETGSVAASDEEAGEADVLMAQQAESRDAEAAVASVFAEPESEHREPDPEVEGGSLAPEAPRDAELPMAESAEPKAAAAAVAAISAEKIESEHLESAGAETPSYDASSVPRQPLLPTTAAPEPVAPGRPLNPAAAAAPSRAKKATGKAPSMTDIVLQQSVKVLAKNILKLQELVRQWDPNSAGLITRKDWRKACPLVGISAAAEHLDALFDRFDHDNDGRVSLPELQRAIRSGGKASAPSPANGVEVAGQAAAVSPAKGGRGLRGFGASKISIDEGEEELPPSSESPEPSPSHPRSRKLSPGGRASHKHKNPFREQDAAALSELAPLGLRLLGMPAEEWGDVQPPAASQIGAELERKSTVFETILRSHLQDTPGVGTPAGRIWETGAPEPPLNLDQLEVQRQVELDRRAALEVARRVAREEQLARERHAISIQATARGRAERRRVAQARPERKWRFQKSMRRSFESEGGGVARFYVEANEIIEIVEVSGVGRLLLTAVDPEGKQVVSSAVVFDSSAHHFDPMLNPAKGPRPPLWTAPGEHEYSFTMVPLDASPPAPPAAGAGHLTVLFRRVMTVTEQDLVEEAAPKPATAHLDPYRRNPRRNSHLEPIRPTAGAAPQREALAPIGSAGRGLGPPPVSVDMRGLLPASIDSPLASSRSYRGLSFYRTEGGGHPLAPDLPGYQTELGERTRDRAAQLEAQQVEEERQYAAAHGLPQGGIHQNSHSASTRASTHASIPVHADGGAAASVFEQQREIQWQAQAQQAQYLAYLAATQQYAAGWPDAANHIYAQYMAQSHPGYGSFAAESATGPTELKALMGPPKGSTSPVKPRKGPRTGGFGR